MLFFYGTGNSRVGTVPLPALTCVHCHSTGTLSSAIFSRYVHFFWIPVFPIGKTSVSVCQHCKQTLTLGEMPADYRPPVYAAQARARTPLTNFALLLLFAAGVAFLTVVGLIGKFTGSGKSADAAPLAAASASTDVPALGNRYRVRLGDDPRVYGLAEIVGLTPDTVYCRYTDGLRGPLTAASAAVALRDSVAPANAKTPVPRAQWRFVTSGEGLFRRLK